MIVDPIGQTQNCMRKYQRMNFNLIFEQTIVTFWNLKWALYSSPPIWALHSSPKHVNNCVLWLLAFENIPMMSYNLSLSWKLFSVLPAGIFDSFMYSSSVSSQICLCGSLIVAFSVRIFDSLMYCPLMLNKIRKLFTTLPARILDSFMYSPLVSS